MRRLQLGRVVDERLEQWLWARDVSARVIMVRKLLVRQELTVPAIADLFRQQETDWCAYGTGDGLGRAGTGRRQERRLE